MRPYRATALIASITIALSIPAFASGSGSHEHHEHKAANGEEQAGGHKHHQHKLDWGQPGNAEEVSRTIEVTMGDIYFEPENINAKSDETIRFVVKNIGNLIHEFNIGTPHMHDEHKAEMINMMQSGVMTATSIDHGKMEHSDMKHDDANSVLLEPGQSAELIWKFTQSKSLEFACNVPGHYEAGMVGMLSVGESVSKATE